MRVTWVQPEDLVRHELWQSASEGRDAGAIRAIRDRWAAAGGAVDPPHVGASPEIGTPQQRELAGQLLQELAELPDPTATTEPSSWPEISAQIGRPIAAAPVAASIDFADRLHAGWLGRAVGCVLGKPVEKVPRAGIEAILRSTGRWPLDRYFTSVGLDPAVSQRWPWNRASRATSLEENIDGTPEDDDINFTLMALRVLEAHGADFSSDEVARGWLFDLPAGRTFTAERIAYRNLLAGIGPPLTATAGNPFREWIGAQIRTDLYGWVNPGNPGAAAEWAFRDAAVSHTRNGIYGAMFVAAMASKAVVSSSVSEVLDAGASVVPAGSRMSAAIRFGRQLAISTSQPTDAFAALEGRFAGMHWVHSLNNSALVAYALAAGAGEFDRSICLVVMGGWDTDSNGATVGAVTGALHGTAGIAAHWSTPLKNRISTSIPGCDGLSFDDLAERTLAVATKVHRW